MIVCVGKGKYERGSRAVRRCKVKEIDGVAESKGKGKESWINEINAEEGSGEGRRTDAGAERRKR